MVFILKFSFSWYMDRKLACIFEKILKQGLTKRVDTFVGVELVSGE